MEESPRAYTGVELRPHFLLTELGLRGSALGAFIGACDVKTEHLVDWEDRLAQDKILAGEMVHFIGEFFGATLREGVLRQRLFMATCAQILSEQMPEAQRQRSPISRDGDDLFWEGRKISVSIVTASPVSQLLHVGINVDPQGAPVPAVGLRELGVDAQWFAKSALERFASEWESIEWACAKVRPVV
ncbi:DUF366 family protein [bacterium]|nr:DUF366 family protein [bacterium]